MNYLITGGAGFVGSHLAEALLAKNDSVTIIDDLSTGSMRNIEHLKSNKRFRYVIDTVMNKSLLCELVDECQTVFHLAAAVGVKLIVESPVRTIETNIRGTENVLECANKKRRKVLITSTSEVYGKSLSIPFREDGDLLLGATYKGRWSYACSKAIDEFLALAYWKERKLPVVIVRLFNTVGPKQTGQYGMVVPTFVKQALLGHPITVYGNGKQRRCFTHVKDSVRALIALAEAPKAVGQVFNIGSSQEISIEGLAKLVKEMTRSKSRIQKVPYNKAYEEGFEDMNRRVPDISKVNRAVGYKPTFSIQDILNDVILYTRNGATI
jgi:UDP-glucose 4-epimerase